MSRTPRRRDGDPTEAALSAIQEALNIRDDRDSDVPEAVAQLPDITAMQVTLEDPKFHRKWEISDKLIQTWIGLVIVQLALIGGAVAVTRGIPPLDHWNVLLVTLGASCVGFGLANLINHFSKQRQARELELDYLDLKERADLLVAKAHVLLRRSKLVRTEAHSESPFLSR